MKHFIIIILTCSLLSCSTSKKFENNLANRNCEDALKETPEKQTDYKLVSEVQQATGTVFSYSAVGAAATVQLLWNMTSAIGLTVVLCAPSIATTIATQGKGHANLVCLPADTSGFWAPPLAKKTYASTESWRCPPVDSISQSLRKVAQCYVHKGGSENHTKALATLDSVNNSGAFYRCLSTKEREDFLKDRNSIKDLVALSPTK